MENMTKTVKKVTVINYSIKIKEKNMKINSGRFTLIELLVSTVISSLHFLTQKTAIETKQRIPLFLKRGVGFGERGKTSFPVKRSFPFS